MPRKPDFEKLLRTELRAKYKDLKTYLDLQQSTWRTLGDVATMDLDAVVEMLTEYNGDILHLRQQLHNLAHHTK